MTRKSVVMVGGTGFVGTQLAAHLESRGYALKLLTRRRERKKQVLMLPHLELVQANVHDASALASAFEGADVVVSMAGILNENRRGDFERVHAKLPGLIADACVASGVPRLLHVSALGSAENAPSEYLRTKAAGEARIAAADERGVNTTIFRPSVIFGPHDDFINRFASLLSVVPMAMPLACARARFAPVYVGDVVQAMANSIDDKHTFGQRYALCGPEQMTLLEIVRYIGRVTGNERPVVPLGAVASQLQARVMGMLPVKIFTMDNYRSMQVDSVCDGDDLAALGVTAHGMESVVPGFLGTRSKQSGLDRFRAGAGRG